MTFILIDIGDGNHALQLQNASWLPIARRIAVTDVLDERRSETILTQLCTEISKDEAKRVGLFCGTLAQDETLTGELDRNSLQRIAEFAEKCEGFKIC